MTEGTWTYLVVRGNCALAEPTKRAAGTHLFHMNVSTNEASRWDELQAQLQCPVGTNCR
jgi:hypothetical protein